MTATKKEQAQQRARDEGRQIIDYPDGTWLAMPTAAEIARAGQGCTCKHPQTNSDGYCDLCGYLRVGGYRTMDAPSHPDSSNYS